MCINMEIVETKGSLRLAGLLASLRSLGLLRDIVSINKVESQRRHLRSNFSIHIPVQTHTKFSHTQTYV